MKEMWNKRYSETEYVYGKCPNAFFVEQLSLYDVTGNILLPAEGEGRNAVYAAQQGLTVSAFDISEAGQQKALQLATAQQVTINYAVGDFLQMNYAPASFDACALIFAHFSPPIVSAYYERIAELIKPGGFIILEGFSKAHQAYQKKNPQVGGPKNVEMLFSTEGVQRAFKNFKTLKLTEEETLLNEGEFHIGEASVIRFVGKKQYI